MEGGGVLGRAGSALSAVGGVHPPSCVSRVLLLLLVAQVHRFHPPLAYGRTMGCAPDASVGAALCKVEPGITGKACFGIITYA